MLLFPYSGLIRDSTMKHNSALLETISLLTSSFAIITVSQPGISAPTITKANTYQPFPVEICQTLRKNAANALTTNLTLKKSTFTNFVTGEKGMGCTMEATGTGAKFISPANVVAKLKSIFIGWDEDLRYRADGPTGRTAGFTRDNGLLFLSVNWEPNPSAKCPKNRPIGECNLKPQQEMYKIKLQGAMK